MATKRSFEEQLSDLNEKENQAKEKVNQIKAQKQQLLQRQKAKERKQRNHRLILAGAEIERILQRPLEDEDIEKLAAFLENQEQRGKYFSSAMNKKNT